MPFLVLQAMMLPLRAPIAATNDGMLLGADVACPALVQGSSAGWPVYWLVDPPPAVG
jgi:hypothetical protein